jgi:hypothetical protein
VRKVAETLRPPRRVSCPWWNCWSTRAKLWDVIVRSGVQVLEAMLEEDRRVVCGPRYRHQPARRAGRAGTVRSAVVLGGRRVAVRRPRVRAEGREIPLPTFAAFAEFWGAYGSKPDDANLGAYDLEAPPAKQFRNPVHCADLSNDGFVYVCDRVNDRPSGVSS